MGYFAFFAALAMMVNPVANKIYVGQYGSDLGIMDGATSTIRGQARAIFLTRSSTWRQRILAPLPNIPESSVTVPIF